MKQQKGIFEKVPGSKVWWIRYADLNGKIRRERAGTKSVAQKLYGLRKAEVLQGRKLPANMRAKAITFADIAVDALEFSRTHKRSFQDDKERMEVLLGMFANVAADSLTPKEIERKLLATAGEREWKPATINRYKALLSLTFRVAVENGRVQTNPVRLVRRLREDNGVVRFLSEQESERLRLILEPTHPERWAAVKFAIATGLRAGEQFGLDWKDVYLTSNPPCIHLAHTKNGKARYVALNHPALAALKVVGSLSGASGSVFLSQPYRAWFDAAIRAAEVKGFHWHCLRHTFGSTLTMRGVDIRTLADLMGHKSLQMTMRYSHLAPGHDATAVAKLDDFFQSTGTTTDTEPKLQAENKVIEFHQVA